MPIAQELPIDTDATALDMADAIFGQGITITSASYTGANAASGIYSNGEAVAPGITPSDTGVILSTGNATSVTNASGTADTNTSAGTSSNNNTGGDADLTSVSGQTTYDAAIFEAEFVPDGSTLTMQIVFSSEEYLEYVNSGFNDAVGVWVNGEPAKLTVGAGDITINNINDQSNANLYVDNAQADDNFNTEMDGFTVALTLKAQVKPDEVNTIKIGIADGGDQYYDSNLLIAGDSVQTALIAQDDDITVKTGATETFDLLGNDISATASTLTITAINGTPVSIGDEVTLATGETILLTDTGLILATGDTDAAQETTNSFTYEVTDADGNTDVAFVNLTTIPCFVAGTLIETDLGPLPVELLQPGMRVQTKDRGAQKVRWVGQATREAAGLDAPIEIGQNALGAHQALSVSPNHRILISDPRAALYFDTAEVFIAAKFLTDLPGIKRADHGNAIRYVHILFDQHEVIETGGIWSESYHPAATNAEVFADQRSELLQLFPQLSCGGPNSFGPAARLVVRKHEAKMLIEGFQPPQSKSERHPERSLASNLT